MFTRSTFLRAKAKEAKSEGPTLLSEFADKSSDDSLEEIRRAERLASFGWAEGDPYSADEILRLWEIHCSLVCDHILTYRAGGALWQNQQGRVADLAISPVLRMVDDAFREPSLLSVPQFHDLMKRVGATVALAVNSNNGEFFRQLATVIEQRANGESLADLTPKDLGLKVGAGRQKSPSDLSRLFPLSLATVSGRRLLGYAPDGEYTKDRVERSEICEEIRSLGATISESELSRWLGKFEFRDLMKEQPIARKRAKKAD